MLNVCVTAFKFKFSNRPYFHFSFQCHRKLLHLSVLMQINLLILTPHTRSLCVLIPHSPSIPGL